MSPEVISLYHVPSCTWTHVLVGADGRSAAIIDPVLDYDPRAGRTSTVAADQLLAVLQGRSLQVEWILETHAHADHLTAAAWLRDRLGARVGIGAGITGIQQHFKGVFGLGDDFATDGRQFDRLFADGDSFSVGGLEVRVITTPGHTNDSVTYVAGDAAFIGDTVFAPGSGTARCDFPGGDARALYRSVRRIYALGDGTRLYLCHDYPAAGQAPLPWVTVADEKTHNPHLAAGTSESEFVALRTARDRGLKLPELIIPSIQVNIRAGLLPETEANGIAYLRVPLNLLGGSGNA